MKKNKMLRIASVLLVAVLISTCAISGTFAKYVTKASGEDVARVAKWGVLVTLDGEAFAEEYAADDSTYKPAYADSSSKVTVQTSVEGEKLVAPGTGSEGLTATLTGTPEVAVRYTLDLSKIVVPVLPKGTYTDYTKLVEKAVEEEAIEAPATNRAETGDEATAEEPKLGYYGEFTLEEDYYPVVFTLSINGTETQFRTLDELAAIFTGNSTIGQLVTAEIGEDKATLSVDFSPNTELPNGKATFALSWKWAFEQKDDNGDVIELYDMADTYLGNVAAGVVEVAEDAGVVTDVSFVFAASATQID